MKRPIDPNLNGFEDEVILGLGKGTGSAKKNEFGFENPEEAIRPRAAEPNFVVSEKEDADKSVKRTMSDDAKAFSKAQKEKSSASENSGEHHHSSGHHHSSSHHGSSHHSSSHHSSSHHGSSHHSSSHHSSSKHHHSKKKKSKSKLSTPVKIMIGLISVLLAIVLLIGGTFGVLRYLGSQDFVPSVENSDYSETIEYNGHTYKYNENMISIGFIGVDQENLETSEETDFVGAADTDIVIAIDNSTGKTTAIAIPRDTMVDIDIYSESGIFLRTEELQLCLAYAYGDGARKSCEGSIGAMSRVLYNVPVQKYFALDLSGIAPLNDAIGGVTVDSLYDFKDLGIKKGDTITIKGDMAETYVRQRDMDNIEASLNRVQRQVQYIKAYAQQLAPAVMQDFGVVSNLYNTAQSYSQTNLSLRSAVYLASLLLSNGVSSFETYTISGEMKASEDPAIPNVVHAEFYADEESVMEAVLNTFYTQID